jgi:hypothetical protein
MEDTYLLEIVVKADRLSKKLETLTRRWPTLREQHKSHFFIIFEITLPEYTQEDRDFLRECSELWIISAYKATDAYKARGRRVGGGVGDET